jgi:hypothetical protein
MTLFEKNMGLPEPTPYEAEVLRRIEAKFPPVRSQQVRGGLLQKIMDNSTIGRFYRKFRGASRKLPLSSISPKLAETLEKLESMKQALNDNGLAYNYIWRIQVCLLYQHIDPDNRYMDNTLQLVLDTALPDIADKTAIMEWFHRAYDPNMNLRVTCSDWGCADMVRIIESDLGIL